MIELLEAALLYVFVIYPAILLWRDIRRGADAGLARFIVVD